MGRSYLKKWISNDKIFIIIIYSLSHGLMLFNRGYYWDDWVLNVPPAANIDRFTQVGIVLAGYFS